MSLIIETAEKAAQDQLESVQHYIKRLFQRRPVTDKLEAAVRSVELEADVRMEVDGDIVVWLPDGAGLPAVQPLIVALRKAGVLGVPEVTQRADGLTWVFPMREDLPEPLATAAQAMYRVHVRAYLSKPNNCRYVQVGVKEEPIYEWQCDDAAEPSNAEEA